MADKEKSKWQQMRESIWDTSKAPKGMPEKKKKESDKAKKLREMKEAFTAKDGGTASSCNQNKLKALESLMGGKKPKMISATIQAKDAKGLKAGAEKVEELAKGMSSKKKKKDSKSDMIKKLRAMLK